MSTPDPQERPTLSVSLRDGSLAELRPLKKEDGDLVRKGMRNMSEESRRARFGVAIGSLSDAEVDYLTDVDQVSHVAWGATIEGEPAGVGRYIVMEEGDCAEVAVTVADPFQRRGLGRALFGALVASARANQVETLCFAVEPDNAAVLRLLQGIETHLDETGGMVIGRISVGDVAPGDNDDELVDLLVAARP